MDTTSDQAGGVSHAKHDEMMTGEPPVQQAKDGLDSATWTYRFKHAGRKYKLFKRTKSRDGAWNIDVVVHGRRIPRSLETNNAAAAVQRAIQQYIEPAKSGRWQTVEKNKARTIFAHIGDVLRLYHQISQGEMKLKTVRINEGTLRLVVRRGLGDDTMMDAKVDEHSTAVLTGKLVGDFEEWMSKDAIATGRNPESNKRSVRAYLRQARSIFKGLNLERFKERGIHLPDLTEFLKRRTARPARLVRSPAADDLLRRTFEASKKLRQEDPRAYIAWLLGLSTLRRGEVRAMKWNWLTTVDGVPVVAIPPDMDKSKTGRLVPLDPNVMKELIAYRKRGEAEDGYVLSSPGFRGGDFRAEGVFSTVDAWMRQLGWKTNHTLHEMRAYGLAKLRDEYGIDTAQAVAGHEDAETTKNHYVGAKSVKGVRVALPLWKPEGKPLEAI
ncbi:MAG TPA: site-specific integrase, partial [Verrucomicrobiae bacterium]|nr:site-specific integrase [Verrucomicrobiae bacterium]